MKKTFFYPLAATFVLLLGACKDEEAKSPSITDPSVYVWVDDKKGAPIAANPLNSGDGWRLENARVSDNRLVLGPATWSQAQREIDLAAVPGWQIEMDVTPNALAGSNEIQWESDKAGNYYQFVLYTDIGKYFINRKGTSATFGPATESRAIEGYSKDKAFTLTIRKANDKLHFFIDKKFVVSRSYEAGYGKGLDLLGMNNSQATISNISIIKTK
ncbi:MAG TPA: hypothetical protein VGD40_02270 [Chryseosolibacter sp.]